MAAAAALWLLLVVAAPVLWTPLAAALYAAGSLICHQLPDRSFHLRGFQLPVCARCLGLYAGGAIGSAAGLTVLGRAVRWRAPMARVNALATAIAALPTAVTFVGEWGLGWPVSNAARAAAAVPLGSAVAFVVVSAVATLHYEQCAPTRPIGSSRPPTST
jgi:uncharacterized membrane protein